MQPTTRCPHCGRELEPAVITNPFSGETFTVGYVQCSCDGARREMMDRRMKDDDAVRELRAAKKLGSYREAGIKQRYLKAEHPQAETVFKDVKAGLGAYICGPVGTGKTHLASSVARMAVDSGMDVRVTDMLGILSAFKATYGGPGSEDGVLETLCRCDLLVIDDLGKEPPTEWAVSEVFRVVNSRYEAMKPVVITTQFGKPQLAERLASRGDAESAIAIVSRLNEMCRKVELCGSDRRLRNGKG